MRFGFPLGITNKVTLNRKEVDNPSSAQQFTTQVTKFLDKEFEHKTLLGPFNHTPHPLFHCSPILTRPKDEDNRRVIIDLSYGSCDAVKK